MDILPLIPEIKALVPSGQLESRPPRLPFTAGQILQATVSSQTTPHLFTLTIGGQELPVESSAALQPGQTLSVQVTALTPQLQLQIVDHTSTNQRITTALHFMASQGKAFSQIPSLIDAVPQSSQLSAGSQQVLQQMRTNLIGLTAGNSQAGALLQQIGANLQTLPLANGVGPPTNTVTVIGQLLQQLADLPDISPQLRDNITPFAQAFLTAKGSLETVLAQAALPSLLPPAVEKQVSQLSDLFQQMGQNPTLQTLLQPIMEQLGQYSGFREYRFAEQLLSLLIRVGIEAGFSPGLSTDGRQLQQTLHSMGMNLEQLLVKGNMQEAAATLKFALLELSNLSTTNESQSQVQRIDDLLGTIQLSQLMQLRLSAESLFFLPLPFPYLQSGFLLIDTEKEGEHNEKKKKRRLGEDEVSMYLQLEGLGNLQITIHQEKDQIALTFYSQDTERAKFLGQFRDELANILTTGTLYSAHFLIGAKEPVKILIERILHASTGMVNTLA